MPAGVTWAQYLKFCAGVAFTTLAGSQVVHMHYKPLQDLHLYIDRELDKLPPDVRRQIENEVREEVAAFSESG